jgi:hypothetical protein
MIRSTLRVGQGRRTPPQAFLLGFFRKMLAPSTWTDSQWPSAAAAVIAEPTVTSVRRTNTS